MTYVVTEQCIRCRYTDCVVVCPVDCFHAGEEMLVIDAEVCIDCAVCEPACPVEAIKPDTHAEGMKWKDLNRDLAAVWPVITAKAEPHTDAEQFAKEQNKYEKFLQSSL